MRRVFNSAVICMGHWQTGYHNVDIDQRAWATDLQDAKRAPQELEWSWKGR